MFSFTTGHKVCRIGALQTLRPGSVRTLCFTKALQTEQDVGPGEVDYSLQPSKPAAGFQLKNGNPLMHDFSQRWFRDVTLRNLAPNTTLADITAGIRDTAPVGKVQKVEQRETLDGRVSFLVRLGSFDAAALLVQAAKEGKLIINNKSCFASVLFWGYHHSDYHEFERLQHDPTNRSRVLKIYGHPDAFENVSPDSIRQILRANQEAMDRAGKWGLQSEPVITQRTTIENGEDEVAMIWPFFNTFAQTDSFLDVLRDALASTKKLPPNKHLHVGRDVDPCGRPTRYPALSPERREELIAILRLKANSETAW